MNDEQLNDFYAAGESHGGQRSATKRAVKFDRADTVPTVTDQLGVKKRLIIPRGFEGREAELFIGVGDEIGVRIARKESDDQPRFWVVDRKHFYQLLGRQPKQDIDIDIATAFRCTSRRGSGSLLIGGGWFAKCEDGLWHPRSVYEIRLMVMARYSISSNEASVLMGGLAANPIEIVCMPFMPEYPKPGLWNMNAPQFRFQPTKGTGNWEIDCPTWLMIFAHVMEDLAGRLPPSIRTPAAFLFLWVCSAIRQPAARLPYLFFYGPENSGKSIIHEAIAEIITAGVVRADRALTSTFNGELEHTIFAVVEERNIGQSDTVYNRLKDFVTSHSLAIRRMRTDQYMVPNHTSWIHTSNDRHSLPVLDGGTRIVALHVERPSEEIAKEELLERLRAEAPKFIWNLLNAELPEPSGRLALPAIVTQSAERLQAENRHELANAIPMLLEDIDEWTGTASELASCAGVHGASDLRKVRSICEKHKAFLDSEGIAVNYSDNRRKPIVIRRI